MKKEKKILIIQIIVIWVIVAVGIIVLNFKHLKL